MKKIFDIDSYGLIILNAKNDKVIQQEMWVNNESEELPNEIIAKLTRVSQPVVYSELRSAKVKANHGLTLRFFRRLKKGYDIELVFPLPQSERTKAMFLIGLKLSQKPYTTEDINVLQSIGEVINTALERALLYKELQDLAKSLEVKVAKRTRQLQENLDHIEELRRQERDMVDIMGHELRTPLSIAKLAFPRLMRFVNPKVTYKERVPVYEKRIRESLRRESTLIETLLSATKLENKKLELSIVPVAPVEIVNNTMLAFKNQAEAKALKLIVKDQAEIEKLPMVAADATRVQEILDNLVSNAVKYTDKGSVTITVAKDQRAVRFSVTDTGIGIPKSAIPNLGKKFFRVSQHINEKEDVKDGIGLVRPGGTGLGLFVVFGLVKSHHGILTIKSKVGKGSTFSFTIPVMGKAAVAKARATAKQVTADSESPDLFVRYGLKNGK